MAEIAILASAQIGTATLDFDAAVRQHQNMVYSLALHFLRDHAVAEELAQEVFLELHRQRFSDCFFGYIPALNKHTSKTARTAEFSRIVLLLAQSKLKRLFREYGLTYEDLPETEFFTFLRHLNP